MSAPFSASVLFRVCLPMVSWAGRVPSAAEPATPGLSSRTAGDVPDNINRLVQEAYTNAGIPGSPLGAEFFTDATIDLQSGYEWERPRADGSTTDLSRCYGPVTSSARIDIGDESGSRFLRAEKRGTEIARFSRGKGPGAHPLSYGAKGSRMEIMHPDAPGGRWLRVNSVDIESLDAIGWATLGMAPRTEQLTLCFIGLLGIAPSILRRRGAIGGKHAGHRRRSIHTGHYRTT
jgi:hypothetical protein